jgi:hypothetical protein
MPSVESVGSSIVDVTANPLSAWKAATTPAQRSQTRRRVRQFINQGLHRKQISFSINSEALCTRVCSH